MTIVPIRAATQADVPELVRVINLAYRVEDYFKVGDRTNAVEIAALVARDDAGFLVIDGSEPGKLAGGVYYEDRGTRGYLGLLSVDPSRQGEGLGRLLIDAVERHFRDKRYSELELTVVNLREELPPFYGKFGFVVTGENIIFEPATELRRPAHLVVMSKSLR